MLILNFLNVEPHKFEKAECCFRIFCKFKCFIQMHLDEVKTSGLLVRIFSRRHLLLKRDRELICWKHAKIDLKFWTFHSYQVMEMNVIRKVWLYLSFEWNQIVTITGGWEQNLNIYMNILNDFKLIYIKVTYAVNNNYNENEKMKEEER